MGEESGGSGEGSDEPPLTGRSQADAANDDAQEIRCTTEHPFWVQGRGWVPAGDLRPGDELVGSKGERLVVVAQEVRQEEADHYNFEVEDFHTYFVSETEDDPAVWVHNRCRFVDTDTLVNAIDRGDRAALSVIGDRSGQTYITSAIRREFLNVSTAAQRTARRRFLRANNIRVHSASSPSALARLDRSGSTAAQRYRDVRDFILRGGHSRTDAEMIALADMRGLNAFTAEKRVYNWVNNNLRNRKNLGPPVGVSIGRTVLGGNVLPPGLRH